MWDVRHVLRARCGGVIGKDRLWIEKSKRSLGIECCIALRMPRIFRLDKVTRTNKVTACHVS